MTHSIAVTLISLAIAAGWLAWAYVFLKRGRP